MTILTPYGLTMAANNGWYFSNILYDFLLKIQGSERFNNGRVEDWMDFPWQNPDLPLGRRFRPVPPLGTVREDFPHTALRWSHPIQHYGLVWMVLTPFFSCIRDHIPYNRIRISCVFSSGIYAGSLLHSPAPLQVFCMHWSLR